MHLSKGVRCCQTTPIQFGRGRCRLRAYSRNSLSPLARAWVAQRFLHTTWRYHTRYHSYIGRNAPPTAASRRSPAQQRSHTRTAFPGPQDPSLFSATADHDDLFAGEARKCSHPITQHRLPPVGAYLEQGTTFRAQAGTAEDPQVVRSALAAPNGQHRRRRQILGGSKYVSRPAVAPNVLGATVTCPRVLILWDVDNLCPPGGAAGEKLWACTLQEAALRLGGQLEGFVAFANPATMGRMEALPQIMLDCGGRLEVASTSKQSVDLLVTAMAVAFARSAGGVGRLVVASNDTDFAPVLRYVGSRRCDTMSLGTWHQKSWGVGHSYSLRWTRYALAQAANVCVLWDRVAEEEPPQLRSKPEDHWHRLAVSHTQAQLIQRWLEPPWPIEPISTGTTATTTVATAAAALTDSMSVSVSNGPASCDGAAVGLYTALLSQELSCSGASVSVSASASAAASTGPAGGIAESVEGGSEPVAGAQSRQAGEQSQPPCGELHYSIWRRGTWCE